MRELESDKRGNYLIVKLPDGLGQHDFLSMREHFTKTYFVNGHINIVLDCEDVTELPSIAFGTFCSLARIARRLTGSFSLVHVPNRVQIILKKTHVDQQVPVYSTIVEATQSAC